jgi:O-antigen ligase
MPKNIAKSLFLNKVLIGAVFLFPLIIVFRSAAINIVSIVISIIALFFILKKKETDFFKNKLVNYLVLFFAFIFVNSLIHYQSFDLLIKSLGNFRYLLLSAGVFLFMDKASDKEKFLFIYFNLALIAFISLDIIYQYFFYRDIFGFVPGICAENFGFLAKCQRFSGVFGNELIAGAYLSQIGILILVLLKNSDSDKTYFCLTVKNILFLLGFIIVIITGERNATLIFLLFLFFNFLFQKKLLKLLILFFFMILILFTLTKYSDSTNVRFKKIFTDMSGLENPSLIEKIDKSPWGNHYHAAFELFLEQPILGHGPKSFRIKCKKTKIEQKLLNNKSPYLSCATHPHNYLLEFLSEHGIVGGMFFIGLILLVILKIYKIKKNDEKNVFFTSVSLGCLILAVLFPFKPSGSFFSTFNASMLFYIFGFFLHYSKKIK